MTDLRQAAQQALDAYESTNLDMHLSAIHALRTALAMHKVSEFAQAQEQAEPFGYFRAEPFGWTDCAETDEGAVALYEQPDQRKPLTDAEIDQLLPEIVSGGSFTVITYGRAVARAIEAKLKGKNA